MALSLLLSDRDSFRIFIFLVFIGVTILLDPRREGYFPSLTVLRICLLYIANLLGIYLRSQSAVFNVCICFSLSYIDARVGLLRGVLIINLFFINSHCLLYFCYCAYHIVLEFVDDAFARGLLRLDQLRCV
jgi:hypothetical protein